MGWTNDSGRFGFSSPRAVSESAASSAPRRSSSATRPAISTVAPSPNTASARARADSGELDSLEPGGEPVDDRFRYGVGDADRGPNVGGAAVRHQLRDQLPNQEPVAGGGAEDLRGAIGVSIRNRVADELRHLTTGERVHGQPSRRGRVTEGAQRAGIGRPLAQAKSGKKHNLLRRDSGGEVGEQAQRRLIGGVYVVDDERERNRLREFAQHSEACADDRIKVAQRPQRGAIESTVEQPSREPARAAL